MPAHVGGCDEFGWNPSSKKQVSDLGNLSRSRLRVLLSASVGTPDQLLKKVSETLQLMAEEEIDEEEAYKRLVDDTRSWLASMGGTGEPRTPPQAAAQWLALNLHHKGRVIRLSGDDHGATDVVLASHRQSVAGRQDIVLYDDHAAAVEQRIATFAAHLQLDELTPTLRAAARHHDVGKLDRRFQAWLNGGSAADPALPLAKSEREAGTPISWRARLDARWPRYKRHEALSAALLSNVESWPADVDRDLLLYLVSVHHGDARPFRWFTHDPDPVRVTAQIDGQEVEVYSDEEISWSEHAHRFAALSQRLGTWGLAAVESLLVLADRAVSAEGS